MQIKTHHESTCTSLCSALVTLGVGPRNKRTINFSFDDMLNNLIKVHAYITTQYHYIFSMVVHSISGRKRALPKMQAFVDATTLLVSVSISVVDYPSNI